MINNAQAALAHLFLEDFEWFERRVEKSIAKKQLLQRQKWPVIKERHRWKRDRKNKNIRNDVTVDYLYLNPV